jgi:hypothetical protein
MNIKYWLPTGTVPEDVSTMILFILFGKSLSTLVTVPVRVGAELSWYIKSPTLIADGIGTKGLMLNFISKVAPPEVVALVPIP